MKTPYKNIFDVLKLNRFIVLGTIIGAVLTCIVSVLMVIKLHRESMDNAFVVNGDGSVIPLKMVSQLENLEVEAKAHLELFHGYFYGIDASNYEKNLEKALWLGNSSVDALYRQKKRKGSITVCFNIPWYRKYVALHPRWTCKRNPIGLRPSPYLRSTGGRSPIPMS